MNLEKIIENSVTKRKARTLLIFSSFAWSMVAASVLILSFTLGSIMQEWNLTKTFTSSLASSTFLGMFLGAISSGLISDYFGRKTTSIVLLIIGSIFGFLSGFSTTPAMFMIFRVISGFGFGGLMPAINTYLTEFLHISFRGKYLVFLETSWAFGSIFIAIIHLLIGRNFSWRSDYYFLILGLIPAVVLCFFPESPKYLITKHKFEKFNKLYKTNLSAKDFDNSLKNVKSITFFNLFVPKFRKISINIFLLWFTMSFGYYGIFVWIKDILLNKGVDVVTTDFYTFFMLVAQLPGFLLSAYLIEKIGRRKSILLFTLGTAFSMVFFALSANNILVLILGLIVSVFCLGAWGITYAYTPELFPTQFRGTANGTSGAVTRFAGFLAPFYTSFFISKDNMMLGLFGISILFLITGLFNYKFLPETKSKDIY
jgi:putative MFS transporter